MSAEIRRARQKVERLDRKHDALKVRYNKLTEELCQSHRDLIEANVALGQLINAARPAKARKGK
jgi:hypothetical protein